MEFLLFVKNLLGVASDEPLVLYAIGILILVFISMTCFINILWYAYVKYFLSNNEKMLKFIEKRTWLKRIANLYSKTSTGFIIFELMLYFFCTGTIIQTSIKIIYYMQ